MTRVLIQINVKKKINKLQHNLIYLNYKEVKYIGHYDNK